MEVIFLNCDGLSTPCYLLASIVVQPIPYLIQINCVTHLHSSEFVRDAARARWQKGAGVKGSFITDFIFAMEILYGRIMQIQSAVSIITL